MKKLLITLLFAAGLLTACTTATHTAKKRENTGKAILGISPGKKEIIVTAVTAGDSPVQVEGCTVTELPSDEETILTATGTKVVLKGNITELDCCGNQLTSLDVRGLTALQTLYCDNNLLTSIDLHGLTALQTLYCDNNRLSSLDVRHLTALQWLDCHFNKLTSLDVQGLPALQVLACSDNQLTALNVQDLPALQALSFQHNRLEEDAIIRILNSLPDRKTDEEGLAVLYSEGEKLPKESGSAVPASAEFRAAFKAAKQKNWKLYMQTEDENGTEIRLQEE